MTSLSSSSPTARGENDDDVKEGHLQPRLVAIVTPPPPRSSATSSNTTPPLLYTHPTTAALAPLSVLTSSAASSHPYPSSSSSPSVPSPIVRSAVDTPSSASSDESFTPPHIPPSADTAATSTASQSTQPDPAASAPAGKNSTPLHAPIPSEPTRVHPLSHSASANSFLRIPPLSSSATLNIPPTLQVQTNTRPPSASASVSEPASPSSSPSYTRSPASLAWFGASHYDQVDASFHRDTADIPVTIEEEKKDVFSRRKHRLGKATYLIAPTARNVEPTVQHITAHDEPLNTDDKEPTIPAAIESSAAVQRRSSSSNALVKEEPPPPADTSPTPPGTDSSAKAAHQHNKLGQWPSTAICANDITSSCFYAISICVQSGGIWAPLCFLFVVGVLYLFRKVYGEAVTALPLNGGAYNVLLNTTSKKTAAFAGCLSLLSYMATGVVSAASAMSYLRFLVPSIPLSVGVIVILAVFAALTLWGIQDSANVAYGILIFHM